MERWINRQVAWQTDRHTGWQVNKKFDRATKMYKTIHIICRKQSVRITNITKFGRHNAFHETFL